MNTVLTRRPLLRRLWARVRALYIDQLIKSREREVRSLIDTLDALPDAIDTAHGHLATLRVQLALAEKES
jgi:hypothetical protein